MDSGFVGQLGMEGCGYLIALLGRYNFAVDGSKNFNTISNGKEYREPE